MAKDGAPPAEVRYAWVMAGVGFAIMLLSFGLIGSLSVFLKPLAAEFGWSRGELGFAYTMGTIGSGLGGVAMGYLSDRQPVRPMVLFGLQVLIGCLLFFSSVTALWQFYAIYLMVGFLGFAALGPPTINAVGQWFTRNPGLAIGIVSAGGGAGQGLVPFLARYLITLYGWRWAYILLAIGYAAVALPLVALVRTSPGQAARLSARTAGTPAVEAPFPLPTRVVLPWLSLAVVFCCITMATPIVHVAALASDKGYGPQQAAGIFMTIMVAGILGRVLVGKVADVVGGLRAYLMASFIQTALVYGFVPLQSLPALYTLAAVYGIGYSAVMTCLLVCARELVPASMGGSALGIVTCLGWAGMGLGGWQAGYFFDLTGDYHQSFLNAALSGVVNLALVLGLTVYTTRRRVRFVPVPAAA